MALSRFTTWEWLKSQELGEVEEILAAVVRSCNWEIAAILWGVDAGHASAGEKGEATYNRGLINDVQKSMRNVEVKAEGDRGGVWGGGWKKIW